MSRPLKSGLNYFPHDTMAHADPKISSLMALYGAEGYAFYFIILEIIFRSENGRITIGKLPEKIGLAHSMCMKLKRFEQILSSAIEIGCFDENEFKENNILTSNGVSKRISKIKDEREADRIRKEAWKEKERTKEKELKEKEKEKEKTKTGKLPENSGFPAENSSGLYNTIKHGKTFPSDSIEIGLSELLLSLIREKNPNHKQPNIQEWAKHIDAMIRIDHRQPTEIREIIISCQKDSFWHANILSTQKLREKYDQLKIKLNRNINPKEASVPYHDKII